MMTPEQAAAYVEAQAALLKCRVAGMEAENQHRANVGWAVAYGDEAFEKTFEEFASLIGHNACIELFREANS